VIPDVAVTVTNDQTKVSQQSRTDSTGVYDVPSVIAGNYTLTFSKDGFKKYVRSGVSLLVQTITVDAQLQVGSVAQEISVHAAVTQVETESSERKTDITSENVTEIPNVGRSWYELTALMPGVNGGNGQNASGEGVGINGTGPYQANWLIDGGVDTYPDSQNPDWNQIPLEGIEEIDLKTSNFSAEYGNGLALYNVISKSGTNQWHGGGYEFVQNNKLEARNFFSPSIATLRWNEFGGDIGGPIKKDKAFFFFNYQYNPTNAPNASIYTYPTAAMREGDFSAAGFATVYNPNSLTQVGTNWTRTPITGNSFAAAGLSIDPVAKAIEGYFPTPNYGGASAVVNNYYFAGSNPNNTTTYHAKVDYNLTATNRLTGSFVYGRNGGNTPAPTCPMAAYDGGSCTSWIENESQEQLTDVWTISPTLVNEARISFLRVFGKWTAPNFGAGYPEKIGLNNAQANAFPNITVGGAYPTFIGGGLHALLAFQSFVPSDSFTLIHGKHILKIGGEFNKWGNNLAWADVRAGDFSFTGAFTRNPSDSTSVGIGYADFLFGLPQSWGVGFAPETGGRIWNLQTYVQDDYKLKHNLTLNIGVRYMVQPGWTEAWNRIGDFDPNLENPASGNLGALWFAPQGGRTAEEKTIPDLFAPRIGFAWSPKANWSIRGGYGIFDIMWGGNTYMNNLGVGYSVSGAEASSDQIHPIFTMQQGPPLPVYPTAAARTASMLNGQGIGYTPYNTPESYTQEEQLSVEHQIGANLLIDVGYVHTNGTHLGYGRDLNQIPADQLHAGVTQADRPYPQYLGIGTSWFDGISNYNALQVSAKRQFANGFSFIANYTYSRDLDTGMGSGWGGAQSVAVWQNAYDPRETYGPSTLDSPHMLNGDFIYQLPVGKGKQFMNRGGVLDYVLGGWQVSSLFQLHSGIPFTPTMDDNYSYSFAGSWLPNRIGSGKLSNPTIQQWFDPSAFVQPADYTFGNSGIGILRGPSFKDMDLGLSKSFRVKYLGEGGRIQIKADAFDVFNHPNFGMPNHSIGNPGAGSITSAITQRNIQLGAKVLF
jgi:hypothetical protein